MKLLLFITVILNSLFFAGCHDANGTQKKSSLTLRNLQNTTTIPTNAHLYLEFSKEIDPATVNENTFFLLDSYAQKVDATLDVLSNRVTLQPKKYLDPLHEYSLVVTKALLSTSGHGLLQEYQWNFTTTPHADTKAPLLIASLAENKASIHTEIAFEFNEPIFSVGDEGAILEIRDANDRLVLGESSLEYNIIRFSPFEALDLNTKYSVALKSDISDLYGNEYSGTKAWTFITTEDDNSTLLSPKLVSSFDTQAPLLSITTMDDILIAGTSEGLRTYRIDALTCKATPLHSLALQTPTYVVSPSQSLLLLGSSNGMSLVSINAQGLIGESLNVFYETDAPVYDIVSSGDTAFLAQTIQGVQALDISTPSTPVKMFDLPQVKTATELSLSSDRLYVADNSLQELLTFTLDGNLLERATSHGNIYDLNYDNNTQKLYMAMGLKENARSFVSNILAINYEKEYTLWSDNNRGITLIDAQDKAQAFVTYDKGLFGLANYKSCVFLGYKSGKVQSVDIFAPFVAHSSPESGAAIETVKQSVVLSFDRNIDALSVIEENFTFTDDNTTPVSYILNFDGEKTVRLTSEEALHVKHHYSLHVKNIKDLYDNTMSEPYVMDFTVNYSDNIAPHAHDDASIMDEDTTQSIAILDNDTDLNGDDTIDKSSVIITTSPAHGSVTLNSLGKALYTPYANYFGQDSFQYSVSDTNATASNIATVSITINDVYDAPPNQAPIANADTRTFVTSPLLIDVLSNDTDINGNGTIDPTTVTITQPISGQGTISLNPTTGVVTYTLAATLTFPETFKYTVKDTSGATSNEALVTINP